MFSATDAPSPKLVPPPPPLVPGSAFAVLSVEPLAVSVTLPLFVSSVAPGPMAAVVVALPRTSANEPATPTDPPPAPLVPSAPNVLSLVAVAVRPSASAMPPIVASAVAFASVIATPAPIDADPPDAAWPSASHVAVAVLLAVSVSAPVLETRVPTGTSAVARELEIVSAIAAATLIGPPEVDADG